NADNARADSDEEEAEDDHQKSHQQPAENPPPARKLGKDRDDENQRQRADDYVCDRQVALGPRPRHARFHIAQAFKALSERADDGGQVSNNGNQTAGGHSARAYITYIGAIEPFGMRMTGDPTVAEAELFKIGKDGRLRNVG